MTEKTKRELFGELSSLSSLYDGSVVAMRLFGIRDYNLGIPLSDNLIQWIGPVLSKEYLKGWQSAQVTAGEVSAVKDDTD